MRYEQWGMNCHPPTAYWPPAYCLLSSLRLCGFAGTLALINSIAGFTAKTQSRKDARNLLAKKINEPILAGILL